MLLRRDRVHHHGKTNKDAKTLDAEKPSTAAAGSRLDQLATSKRKNFSAVIEQRIKRVATAQHPIDQTEQFYKTTEKPVKPHTRISYPRFANLEEKELRKRVYCGDSNTIFHEEAHFERERSPRVIKNQHIDSLARTKHEHHANAIQETQLVGLEEYNRNTLEGRVDLEKVREIRRAIRRRYANRKNFQKIFNLWDEDSNGAISVRNLYNMIHRLGININLDEARVLLASSDKDGSHDLALNEFLDLIFNEKDALNVNLKALPMLSEDEKSSVLSEVNTLKYLHDDAKKSEGRRRENQVHLILKNKMQVLGQWFQQVDQLQKGNVNFGRFEGVIKKLQVDPKIISDDDIKVLYDRFAKKDELFDYKSFLSHLKEFQMNPEDVYSDPFAKPSEAENKKQQMIKDMKSQEDERVNLYDCTRVDAWHLEKMHEKARKICSVLQRYVTTKEEFMALLRMQSRNPNRITSNELTAIVSQYLTSVNEKPRKTDLESLLSVMQFGQYESVPMDDIGRIIYEETDEQFFERAQQRKKGPAPPPERALMQQYGSAPLLEMPIDNGAYYSKENGLASVAPNIPDGLARILTKIDNSVFRQSERAYKIFKDFDIDKDGYVSHQDLISKMKQLNVLDEGEVGTLLRYVDPEGKGFTTFTEFHNRLRAGMTITDVLGQQLVLSAAEPSRVKIDNQKTFLPELRRQIEEFKRPYKPETAVQRPATRFGCTPQPSNTFVNVQAAPGSAMFQHSAERFSREPQSREKFQHDEKQRRVEADNARMRRIQEHQSQIQERIYQQNTVNDTKESNKIKTKYLAQWTYEHKAHLKNDYL